MTYTKILNGYLIRLFKGEKLVETLTAFCSTEGIAGGVIAGIGGAIESEIGKFDLVKKEYAFTRYAEDMELLSLNGNVALRDGKSFLHLHAVLSGDDLRVIGGHLKELVIDPTAEIFINTLDVKVSRVSDEETGLKLFQLDREFRVG